MNKLLIGNIIALIASIAMVIAGLQKTKKKVLFVQIIQIALAALGNLVLGGYTGAIVNVLNCVRDVLCYKDKMGVKEKIIISVLAIGISLAFNNLGWIGFLPVIATVLYIIYMNTKDDLKFKILVLVVLILWTVYDIYIKSYTAGIFDIISIIANVVTILRIKHLKK